MNEFIQVAGACECKPGFSGYKCDQCAAGYRQFPDCMPCPCDSRGILPSHDCEGDCLCKANVAGDFCDRCKPGYFALTRDNIEGCLQCDCFGVTDQCTAATLVYQSVSFILLYLWIVDHGAVFDPYDHKSCMENKHCMIIRYFLQINHH